MPCNSGMGSSFSGTDYEARRENDRMARVMCDMLRALEAQGVDVSIYGPDAAKWWAEHKAHDARRKLQEETAKRQAEIREQALSKLSDEERAALGID